MKSRAPILTLLLLVRAAVAGGVAAGIACQADIAVHPVPDPAADAPYAVTVEGVSVPIEKAGALRGAYYARLRVTGRAAATITVRGGRIKAACKPAAANFRVADDALTMEIEGGRRHIITASAAGQQLWPLILIAETELQEPIPGREYDVRRALDPNAKVQTRSIQRVLDECAREGGTVVFGPGTYRTGTIRVGSDTTVYLAPGALIVGSDDPADYPVDEGRKEVGTHGPECSFSRLILFDCCKNSRLIGHGVIDGRGHVVRNKHRRHVQLVDVTGCEYVQIENVVLRNSAEWTLHILGSKDVTVDNVSIINDWDVENTDGIDPDGSVDVAISNCLAFCGDDAVAVKVTGQAGFRRPVMGVTVTDSVLMTRKTALKVGTETYADVSGVRFSGCQVVNSSRGCAVYTRDGGRVSDVTFQDIDLDLREYDGEDKSGEPFRLEVSRRNGLAPIDGVAFENITCRTPFRSLLQGHPDAWIRDVTFKSVAVTLLPRKTRPGRQPLFVLTHCRDVTFENCTADYAATDAGLWGSLTAEKHCVSISK